MRFPDVHGHAMYMGAYVSHDHAHVMHHAVRASHAQIPCHESCHVCTS